MSPSRRQAIDEYQRQIEEDYRKNQIAYELYVQKGEFDKQNNLEEYVGKKTIDYNYGIQEYADKAAIDVSKAQTKSNINVSEYAQKQAIKEAYGQTSPQSETIEDEGNTSITNNISNPKTKTEDEVANEIFKSMEQVFGKLDANTAPYYSAEIQAGYNNGNISDDIMLKLYSKIEKYINPTTSSNSKASNVVNNAMSPIAKKLANSK